MHRSRSAAAIAILGLFACGEAPSGASIAFESQALLEQADRVAIYFYGPGQTCAQVRMTLPRPGAILGPFEAVIDDAGRQNGISTPISPVPVGEYVVWVDAYDGNGALVGSGCAPGQRVIEGETARIRLVVGPP